MAILIHALMHDMTTLNAALQAGAQVQTSTYPHEPLARVELQNDTNLPLTIILHRASGTIDMLPCTGWLWSLDWLDLLTQANIPDRINQYGLAYPPVRLHWHTELPIHTYASYEYCHRVSDADAYFYAVVSHKAAQSVYTGQLVQYERIGNDGWSSLPLIRCLAPSLEAAQAWVEYQMALEDQAILRDWSATLTDESSRLREQVSILIEHAQALSEQNRQRRGEILERLTTIALQTSHEHDRTHWFHKHRRELQDELARLDKQIGALGMSDGEPPLVNEQTS